MNGEEPYLSIYLSIYLTIYLSDEASVVWLACHCVQAAHPFEDLLAVATALHGKAAHDHRPGERGARVAVARVRAPGQIDDAAHVGPGVRAYRDASRVRICAAAPDHEVVRAHRVARAGVARHVQVVQPVEDGLADVESAVRAIDHDRHGACGVGRARECVNGVGDAAERNVRRVDDLVNAAVHEADAGGKPVVDTRLP